MERIERSETSALKAQTPGDYPKNTIRHSTHGECLKSRLACYVTPRIQQVTSLEKLQFYLTDSTQFNSLSNKRRCDFPQLLCDSQLPYLKTSRFWCGGRRFGRICCFLLRTYDGGSDCVPMYITVLRFTEMAATSPMVVYLLYAAWTL